MVYYGDEEFGYQRTRERKRPLNIDYSQPAKSVERALESLMYSCAKSERCISDIRRSLYRWRMNKEDYDPIIERLVREKFVDEERYARAYVREKMNCSGWGRRKIELGLRAKGIPKETIEEALRQIEPERQTEKLELLLYRRLLRERDKALTLGGGPGLRLFGGATGPGSNHGRGLRPGRGLYALVGRREGCRRG